LSEHSGRAHLARTSRRYSSHLSSAASFEVNYPTGTGVTTGSAKNDDDLTVGIDRDHGRLMSRSRCGE
jgi:hypothetical protein